MPGAIPSRVTQPLRTPQGRHGGQGRESMRRRIGRRRPTRRVASRPIARRAARIRHCARQSRRFKAPLRLNIARNGRMFEKNRMTLPNPQALNMTPWRERPRRLGKGRARGFAGRSAVMPSRSTASIQDAPIGLSADQGHARKTPLNRSKGRGASRRARQTRFCLFRMRGRSRLLRRV